MRGVVFSGWMKSLSRLSAVVSRDSRRSFLDFFFSTLKGDVDYENERILYTISIHEGGGIKLQQV